MQLFFAQRYLGDLGRTPTAKANDESEQGPASSRPLTQIERDRSKVILIMSVVSVVFWTGYEQAGGLLNIDAKDFVDLAVMGFEMPASWLQSVTAFFVVLFAPLFAVMWTRMDDKESSSPKKFDIGLLLLGVAFLFMVAASIMQSGNVTVKINVLWLIFTYLFMVFGELCISPIGLSMVLKNAPLKYLSLLMGCWFLCNAAANKIAGIIGGLIVFLLAIS